MVGGCRDVTWQRWQRYGCLATSMRSLFDPCGSWHVTHALATGACSHRYGPRFSAWQLVHASSTVVPVLSRRTFCVPCTLWHDEQESAPSRTGMWFIRYCLLTMFLWQVAQVSASVFAFSIFAPAGAWTLWQVMQPTLRLSCWLPDHSACDPRLWHDVQRSLACCGVIVLNVAIFVLSPPPSTCAWPG